MRKIILTVLILVIIAAIVSVVLPGCSRKEITQEDVNREFDRWWVISYKIMEDEDFIQSIETAEAGFVADKILVKEFDPKGDPDECWIDILPTFSLNEQYRLAKRRNELWEEILVKYKGKQALKEIEGIWSLDEVPELWEKIIKQSEETVEGSLDEVPELLEKWEEINKQTEEELSKINQRR
jgi:hypothetical protein